MMTKIFENFAEQHQNLVAKFVKNLEALSDDRLCKLVVYCDRATGCFDDLAMYEMSEFDDRYADESPLTIVTLVSSAQVFNADDNYFKTNAYGLFSRSTSQYAATLRHKLPFIAKTILEMDYMLAGKIFDKINNV